MENCDGSYGNCIHGVSRQADSMMYKGQAREQINCRNNLTRGCEKRAAFTYRGKLIPDAANGGAITNAKWFISDNGDGKRFLIALDATMPAIFDIDSAIGDIETKPFSFMDYDGVSTQTYYQSSVTSPEQDLGISTVLDTTFITNKNVIPTGDNANDAISDAPLHIVWLKIKTIPPGTVIALSWNDGAGSYNTQVFDGFVQINVDASGNQIPDEADSLRTKEYSGSYHAAAIATLMGENYYNNVVRCTATNAYNIVISQGGDYFEIIDNGDIGSTEELPIYSYEGDFCIVQEGVDEESNVIYFEAYRKSNGTGIGPVTWKEVTAPGSSGVIDRDTMPHVLKRDTSDNFTLEQYDWADRETGDYNSNPYPSCILNGEPIQTLGLFQNKLFMTAGETIIYSATDTYTDLWKESAAYNTDADPFEVFATTDELNKLQFAAHFDDDLIVFSNNGQFIASGDFVHTYSTSQLNSTGSYKADLLAAPVSVGNYIFFAMNYGNYAGVSQFFTDSYTGKKKADSITDHVNDYIDGRIRHIASNSNINVLCCLNDSNPDTMYVYEWRYSSTQEKQQNAWSKWKIYSQSDDESFEFVWINFLDSVLYAVIKHTTINGTEFQLWSLDWDDPPGTYGLDFSVRLDGSFTNQLTDLAYDATLDRTSIATPYYSESLVFIDGADSDDAGFLVDSYLEDGVWYADGDITDHTLIGGIRYRAYREFPKPVTVDSDGHPRQVNKIKVGEIYLEFSAVGDIDAILSKANVENKTRTYSFNNRRVNRYNNLPSVVPYEGASWHFGVRRWSDEFVFALESWSHVGFVIISAEWTGEYRPTRTRVK